VGREKSGRRPARVISPAGFFRASASAIVRPIFSRIRGVGSSARPPPGAPIAGEFLTSPARSPSPRSPGEPSPSDIKTMMGLSFITYRTDWESRRDGAMATARSNLGRINAASTFAKFK
jgi:hypothetical protein